MKVKDIIYLQKKLISSNDDKRMQTIDSIEIYAYRRSKDLVGKREEIKCNNIVKQHKKWLTWCYGGKRKGT